MVKNKISALFILLALIMSIGYLFKGAYKNTFAFNDEFNIESKCAYVCEPNTNTVIYAKNENERRPIASMCKIMTLLISFEELDKGSFTLNDTVTISKNASGMGGSQVFLEENASYSVSELLKSITVASANDASVAMAEFISGSEESFIDKMNEKAKELDMENTFFESSTGLPHANQYSSAKDVYTMFRELIKHKEYFNFSKIWVDEVKHPNGRITTISNTNKLIRFYDGCDSGKTGFTSEAGHCLCASAVRNNTRVISVVISSPDSKTRFKEVSDMFNYVFNNFESKLLIDKDTPLDYKIDVEHGKKDFALVSAKNSLYVFMKKGEKRSFDIDFIPNNYVNAPIYKGETVGKIILFENGKEAFSVDAVINEDVLKASYFDNIISIAKNWSIIG